MTTAFSGSSRLANFREKKNSAHQDPLNIQAELKLTMPEQEEKITAYEPSATFNNTRTSMRLLKGKIQRKQSSDNHEFKSTGFSQPQYGTQPKLSLNDNKEDLKLVLHDSPHLVEKKTVQEPAAKPAQKRIMIQRTSSTKQQPVKQSIPVQQPNPPKQEQVTKAKKQQQVKQQPPKQEPKQQIKQQIKNPHEQKPIRQEEVEQSKDQPGQNDLVQCPEGCGRKFNRKALEKHAKACKIVFMSKRKQFNSQAKRLTSKQQASLVKQNKQKEKFGKTKGFQKTSDNWKAASEDFRAAIKAVRKDDDQQGENNQQAQVKAENQKQVALNLVPCSFCQKMFAQVLLDKHLQNCVKKKEKEQKQKQKQKKKGGAAIKKK